MRVPPQRLVGFGDSHAFPGNDRHVEQTVTLTATPGPSLTMRFGALAIADPWFPEAAPQQPLTVIGGGAQPTTLTTVGRSRADGGEVELVSVAASIGHLDAVVTWQPLVQNEQHMHLDCDSDLGAFYEISDGVALQPLFKDDLHMKGVFDAALTDLIVPMESQGRVVASAFLCSDGPGLYPAWVGYDIDMSAVAVVVDLKVLSEAHQST